MLTITATAGAQCLDSLVVTGAPCFSGANDDGRAKAYVRNGAGSTATYVWQNAGTLASGVGIDSLTATNPPNVTGNVPAGTYILNVSSGGAFVCGQIFTFNIPGPATALSMVATVIQQPSCGLNNGIVSIAAGGGNGNYRFKVNIPGRDTYQVSNIFTNLPPGGYTFTVADSNYQTRYEFAASGALTATVHTNYWIEGCTVSQSVILSPYNITTVPIVSDTFCPGATIPVSFTASGFSAGTVFTAQLSDASGNFSVPTIIGTFTGVAGSIPGYIPPTTLPGANYRIRVVTAAIPNGCDSSGFPLTIDTIPFAPVLLSADSIECIRFRARWRQSTTLGGAATAYRLDVSVSPSFSSFISGYNNLLVSDTFKLVTGLSPGTYYYRVRAVNNCGISTNSTTGIVTLPYTADITITGADSACPGELVTYTGQPSGAASGWNWSTTFGTITAGTGTAVATVQWPITAGGNVTLRLIANTVCGPDTAFFTTFIRPLPGVPAALAADNINCRSFRARWSSALNATGYRLDVSADSLFGSFISGYNNLSISDTIATITGLPAGTFYYRVRAVNNCGVSSNSNRMSVTVNGPSGINITGPVTVCAGQTVTYTAGPTTGVTNWLWSTSTGGAVITGNGTATAVIQWSAAVSGNRFVRLIVSVPCGTDTIIFNTNVLGASPIPVLLPPDSVSCDAFRVNWQPVAGAVSYQLDVATNAGFTTFLSGYNNRTISAAIPYEYISGLSINTNYYIRVRSVTACGVSLSAVDTIRVPDKPPLYLNGPVTVCPNQVAGYTISPLFVSDSWFWIAAGGTITTGQNTAAIVVNWDSAVTITPTGLYVVTDNPVCGIDTTFFPVSIQLPPAAPALRPADSVGCTRFRARWNPITTAVAYELDVATDSAFGAIIPGYNRLVVSGLSRMITGLAAGGVYYYRVRAVNNCGSSNSSSTAVVNLPTLPSFSIIGPDSVCDRQIVTYQAVPSSFSGISYYWSAPSYGTVITNPNAATVQIQWISSTLPPGGPVVRMVAVGACGADTIEKAVTILPAPVLPIADSVVICYDSRATLRAVAAGGDSIFWFSNPTDVQPIASGTTFITPVLVTTTNYWVRTRRGNCLSAPVVARAIVSAAPVVTISQVAETLVCTPSLNVEWFAVGSSTVLATGPRFVPPSNGVYIAKATDSLGCTGQSAPYTYIVTGEKPLETTNPVFRLYPNPADAAVTIQFNQKGVWRVQLYSLTGQLMKSVIIQGTAGELALSDLAAGVYILEISNQELIQTSRLIINR